MFYSQINKTALSPELGEGEMYFITFHLEQKNVPTEEGTLTLRKRLVPPTAV